MLNLAYLILSDYVKISIVTMSKLALVFIPRQHFDGPEKGTVTVPKRGLVFIFKPDWPESLELFQV